MATAVMVVTAIKVKSSTRTALSVRTAREPKAHVEHVSSSVKSGTNT
jgi:hypothetical protein